MNSDALKKSLIVCKIEYIKWVTDKKMILPLLLFLFLKSQVVDTMRDMSLEMSAPYHIAEPFIAICNNSALSMLTVLFYLLLLSDFMRNDGLMQSTIYHTGRKNWVLGQFYFVVGSAGSYLLAILLFTLVASVPSGSIGNSWSVVVQNYASYFPDKASSFGAQLITGNLYRQLSPLMGMLHSFLLQWLYCICMGELVLLFFVLHRKKYGLPFAAFLVVIGTGIAIVSDKAKWLFPAANANLAGHFQNYFREKLFPVSASYGILLFFSALMLLVSWRLAERISFEDTVENNGI